MLQLPPNVPSALLIQSMASTDMDTSWEKTIGTGAYGKLKAATCTTSKSKRRDIAVKIINKKKSPKDILTKFLPREIETLKAIEHENVVQLYEVIETEDAIYLMMEYVEGGDLLDFINSKHYLSERLARNLFTDLLKAVEKCHSVNVVHRDLKCENLLLTPKNKLKLTDFGFARKFDGTKLETYCGSYAYAAPEVILGEPYIGEPVDVWSMGVILYAMVSGKLPFKDSDVRDTTLRDFTPYGVLEPSIRRNQRFDSKNVDIQSQ